MVVTSVRVVARASPEVHVEVHEDLVQLGFADDDGLGELLVERLRAGSLRVLWEPVDLLEQDEIDAMWNGVSGLLTVLDGDGEPACNVRVTDVFETTWGEPDPRLVSGEGYGDEVGAWRRFVGPALADGLADDGADLDDHTVLLVQTVELIEIADD